MKTQTKHGAEFETAKNEKPFTAKELAQEIQPLLEDYFVADFNLQGSVIIAKFPNGQTFDIKIELK